MSRVSQTPSISTNSVANLQDNDHSAEYYNDTMLNEDVRLDPETSKPIINEMYKSHMGLYESIVEKVHEVELAVRNQFLQFGESILQTIGIVAGFGFAGITRVEHIYSFVVGGLLLFLTLAYGIWKFKTIYLSSLEKVAEYSNSTKSILEQRREFLEQTIMNFYKGVDVNTKEFQETNTEMSVKMLGLVTSHDDQAENTDETRFIGQLIIIMIFGYILILGSFIHTL